MKTTVHSNVTFKKPHDAIVRQRGYYIIAPENGCGGAIIKSEWDQVWQYGSNLGQLNDDPKYLQDGVAPQCAVDGLTVADRAFIPLFYKNSQNKQTPTPKGFLDSHSIGNFGWIFQTFSSDKGYVTQK
jgi:hypothetical protein